MQRHLVVLRVISLLLFGVALLGVMGCNGPMENLNPTIALTFPVDTQLPMMAEGTVLSITGTATATGTNNNISSYRWTQSPEVGTFSSTTTFSTTWVAPTLTANPTTGQKAPMDVTLTLTVETSQGGKTVTPILIRVMPAP